MTRKIQSINTVSGFTQDGNAPVSVPIQGRLLWAQGEADGKPTYDFTVLLQQYNAPSTVALAASSTRYVGTRNGGKVHLFSDYPQLSVSSAPATGFYQQITVLPGEGVNLQIYTNTALLPQN